MTTPNDLNEMPEWEEYTVRVKKDPNYPFHGTDIEFNGQRYIRANRPAAVDVEALKLEIYRNHMRSIGWTDAEISEHEKLNGEDADYGYNTGCKMSVSETIDYLAQHGHLPVPTGERAEALEIFNSAKRSARYPNGEEVHLTFWVQEQIRRALSQPVHCTGQPAPQIEGEIKELWWHPKHGALSGPFESARRFVPEQPAAPDKAMMEEMAGAINREWIAVDKSQEGIPLCEFGHGGVWVALPFETLEVLRRAARQALSKYRNAAPAAPDSGDTSYYLKAALEWIDAIPDDVASALPAMPGFDRDKAEAALSKKRGG